MNGHVGARAGAGRPKAGRNGPHAKPPMSPDCCPYSADPLDWLKAFMADPRQLKRLRSDAARTLLRYIESGMMHLQDDYKTR